MIISDLFIFLVVVFVFGLTVTALLIVGRKEGEELPPALQWRSRARNLGDST